MRALFVELPPFERHREGYLDDGPFRALQELLLSDPEAGDVMEGPGACANCDLATRGVARESAEVCG